MSVKNSIHKPLNFYKWFTDRREVDVLIIAMIISTGAGRVAESLSSGIIHPVTDATIGDLHVSILGISFPLGVIVSSIIEFLILILFAYGIYRLRHMNRDT